MCTEIYKSWIQYSPLFSSSYFQFDGGAYFVSTGISQWKIFKIQHIFLLFQNCPNKYFSQDSFEILHFLHFNKITSETHLAINVTHRKRESEFDNVTSFFFYQENMASWNASHVSKIWKFYQEQLVLTRALVSYIRSF